MNPSGSPYPSYQPPQYPTTNPSQSGSANPNAPYPTQSLPSYQACSNANYGPYPGNQGYPPNPMYPGAQYPQVQPSMGYGNACPPGYNTPAQCMPHQPMPAGSIPQEPVFVPGVQFDKGARFSPDCPPSIPPPPPGCPPNAAQMYAQAGYNVALSQNPHTTYGGWKL